MRSSSSEGWEYNSAPNNREMKDTPNFGAKLRADKPPWLDELFPDGPLATTIDSGLQQDNGLECDVNQILRPKQNSAT